MTSGNSADPRKGARRQILVRLEPGMYEWLRRTAFRQRRPMSQVILEALGKFKGAK